MRHGRRLTTSFTLALALAVTLVGCTPEPEDPDPRPAADALATDLEDGTFDAAPLDAPDVADEQLASILGDLAAFPREVTATVVEPAEDDGDGEDAPEVRTVELTWSIDLGEGVDPLETTTSATLTLTDPDGDGEDPAAWTTVWSPTLVHPEATAESVVTVRRTQAARGDVNGRDGAPIVIDRPVFRVGIDKANLTEDRWQPAAEALAAALELDDQAGYVQRVLGAGAAAFPVALTIRQGDEGSYDTQALRAMEGVLLQEDTIPLAPTSTFARAILGGVGEATAEIVDASQGQVVAGDVVGTSGLQRTYDADLRGTPATQIVLTDPAGDVLLGGSDAVEGADLSTTLDVDLQIYAEQRLADVTSASAVVAIQPSTGAVLAAASGPGSSGLSTATVGQYAPGSTFKVATALALIRSGLTPDSPVECTPTVTVDGREFQNFPGYPETSVGTIPLREAIAQSCNTALIAQSASITSADVADAAASLGIGAALPEGEAWTFPYFSGTVPTDATGTTHAADLIGQGEVLASPLAMAGVAASVAAGRTVVPTLVEVAEPPVPVAPAVPLTTEEAQTLQELMFGVVRTGSSTFLQSVPGDPVGAKSGTAQFGTEDPPQTHAWMIAFQGDLAVAVLVEVGDYGTATAGPIIADVLTFAATGA
ncbi:penicillin-binding transpeptidase domain-containing protein [Serinibacter arcticus]|uniref:Beta-lactamase n=1 Tax=Serinibacter arcticus TaxID=1655435 RepID=A0A4Z1DZI0_9MICO|nr:penicillin-binding transpeptidase domain-containing protein [Serinibacter arcticus]TGO04329.1 Cell division protein FtsI [Peptidoglycan synthetase] [Serinibacter arcticus]